MFKPLQPTLREGLLFLWLCRSPGHQHTPHSRVRHLPGTHLTGSRASEGVGRVLIGWAVPPSECGSFCFLHQLIEGNAPSFLALPLRLATSLPDPCPQPISPKAAARARTLTSCTQESDDEAVLHGGRALTRSRRVASHWKRFQSLLQVSPLRTAGEEL